MDDELAQQLRGGVVQGVVLATDDEGEEQICTVQTHDGVVRSGIPVAQPHGFYGHPSDGGITLLLAIEGDQSNLVALPIGLPGARFGKLPRGGAAMVDDAGNRLVFPADGSGDLVVAALLRLWSQTLLLQAQGGVTVRGPATFEDEVTFNAPVEFKAGVQFGADVVIHADLHVDGNITTGGTVNGRR